MSDTETKIAAVGIAIYLLASALAEAQVDHLTVSQSSSLKGSSGGRESAGSGLAPLAIRRKNAQTVKVLSSILGLQPGEALERAHATLDRLSDPTTPPKQEGPGKEENESEKQVLWTLAETNYEAILIKADEKENITSITGFLRPGREMPFEQIGEIKKAPFLNDSQVAWDLMRPNRPLTRVVANGAARKASSIVVFAVRRPELDGADLGLPRLR